MPNDKRFDVAVSGGSTSVEEYRRAMSEPASNLPELTPQQKMVAERLGLPEEEYRRGVLADHFGETRVRHRGRKLGEIIQGVLDGLDGEYRVETVRAEMVNLRWLVRIVSRDREFIVAIPRDLADDILDSEATKRVEKLKSCLLEGLALGGLVAKT